MARPATCAVVRRQQKRGIRYALRVTHNGARHFVPLGPAWEGWTEERVERERALVATLLERGEWTPPKAPEPPAPVVDDAPTATADETFAVVASRFYAARTKRMDSEKSKQALRWRLGAAIAHIGELPITALDTGAVDDMVTALLSEREEVEAAAAAGTPLMRTERVASTGRTYQQRRKGLSNASINKVVAGVRLVLEDARRRNVISHQPVDRHSMVRAQKPNRSFLQVDELEAVLNAASDVEREQRGLDWDDVQAIRASDAPNTHLAARYRVSDTLVRKIRRGELWVEQPRRRRNDIPRYGIWAVLLGTGLRIDELCGLQPARHIDMDSRRISVTRDITKTTAGERVIPMLPFVHAALVQHYQRRRPRPDGRLFETRAATPQTPDNIRTHVIEPIVRTANDHGAGIEHCTPHSLRRTFASILAEIGVPPRRAMYLLGHTDAKFTMGVYQHVLDLNDDRLEALETILGCTATEAYGTLAGRRQRRAGPIALVER
ncbi:MAG: tyrosine-type recombinase/integrase [Mycobacterium sp.]